MVDDKFYLYARFKSSDSTRYYTSNKNYLLEVRVGRFNKRVKITHVDADGKKQEGSERRYEDRSVFEKSWKVIKDVTQEM